MDFGWKFQDGRQIYLKFHFFTHGCQLDVIKASNYSFWGKHNSNIRKKNVLLNKLVVVIFS